MHKILFFHPNNDYTGSTRVLANLIESEYNEEKITIVTTNNQNGFLSDLPNVHIIPIFSPRYHKRKIFMITGIISRLHACLLTLLHGWHYDIFYINTITPFYAAVVGWLYHKHIIYHVHEKFVTRSMNIRLFEYVFNHVRAKHIFVSKYVKSQYPVKSNCRNIVKYNVLPKSFLAEVRMKPIEERERNKIIMISSLTKSKGIFTYIDVAHRMPECTFRLLVSADMVSIMRFLNCKLPSNVELIPAQSNIHPFLQSSDLVVNLSIPKLCIETFGMTILEAMSYGIPAIVPNIGGPTEIVKDGYNGYCIDVTNSNLIVTTIRKMLKKEEYIKLANNSLNRIREFI